jgi:outer membrane lipoprotein-sorting protein
MKTLSLWASLIALVVFTSACSVQNSDEIIEKAVEAQENLESYYGEVTSNFEFAGNSESMTYKEWNVKPNKSRVEMEDGNLFVSNSEQSWSYDKTNHTVTIFDGIGELTEDMPSESEMIRNVLTEMMNSNDVVAKGKETVADRQTIHLSLTPNENQEDEWLIATEYEVWVDEETYMPLKMKMVSDEFTSEMEYTYIEYNIEIDDELFHFEIPEGAKVQTMEDLMQESLTLEELQETTSYHVPELSYLPEGYEFKQASYFGELDLGMAMVEYADSEGNFLMFTISSEPQISPNLENTELVEIGTVEGTYTKMYDMQFVSWEKDELLFELTSTEDLSKEEILQIAEGIQ